MNIFPYLCIIKSEPDYTCQTGDFIKMCTVPSLRMDESDLVKEKKMLTL